MADYLSSIYGRLDETWSFQDTGKPRVDEDASRRIEIRYNQQITGQIEASCSAFDDKLLVDEIHIRLSLINARIFGGYEVFHLARTLASIVVDDEAALSKSEEAIRMAMIDAMWQLSENASGNPESEFSASGQAQWFRSTDWAKFDYVS